MKTGEAALLFVALGAWSLALVDASMPIDEARLSRSWIMRRKLVVEDDDGGEPLIIEDEDCPVALSPTLRCRFADGSVGAWEVRKSRKEGEGKVRIEVQNPIDKDELLLYEADLVPGRVSSTSTRWVNGRIYRSSIRATLKKRDLVGEFTMHPQGLPPLVDTDCFRI